MTCLLFSWLTIPECILPPPPTPPPPHTHTHPRLSVSLPRGPLCDLMYTLHAALPSYSPQQLLQLLQLLPAWRSPPAAAVNAKRTLLQGWFTVTQQLLQTPSLPAPGSSSGGSGSSGSSSASTAVQASFAAAAIVGLANAHVRPPTGWLQSALLVLVLHWRTQNLETQGAAGGLSPEGLRQVVGLNPGAEGLAGQNPAACGAGVLNPDQLSRVVLALSKLGCQLQPDAADVLLQATQVGGVGCCMG